MNLSIKLEIWLILILKILLINVSYLKNDGLPLSQHLSPKLFKDVHQQLLSQSFSFLRSVILGWHAPSLLIIYQQRLFSFKYISNLGFDRLVPTPISELNSSQFLQLLNHWTPQPYFKVEAQAYDDL